MPDLVDHLAELTGFRDRELLDVTLVGALRDLISVRSVAIYRAVGDAGQERWLTRARLAAGELAASADPAWVDPDSLPHIDADPLRRDAFRGQCIVAQAGNPQRTVFPVGTERESLGVMEIETDTALDERDRRMVLSILRIYRNFQGLLDYSERDSLTGLLNRKSFDESFMKMAAAPAQGRTAGGDRRLAPDAGACWLGVIDIDHFKRVNDRFGHLIGDEVLLLMSRLMRASFRFHDRLYRFGGEEFVVLMRCTGAEAAAQAFERLRGHIERHEFPQAGRITVSIGFTGVRVGDTPNGAFERADRAVYHAKAQGRNRVSHHAELVASGELQDEAKVGDVELF